MRSEQEMMALILDVATRDDRIRAVYMNGSRANPNAPADKLRDYDIVYGVCEMESFLLDGRWIDVFGERIMLQEPDRLDMGLGRTVDIHKGYGYLMLLADGNRIDLTLEPTSVTKVLYGKDSLTVPLLDKDGLLRPISTASDRSYWIKPPTMGQYESCTNNFWWCLQNVGKGLVRNEIPYAHAMYEQECRHALSEMVCWWLGMRHDYRVNAGKMGKWFERFLPPDIWQAYTKTYATGTYASLWKGAMDAGALFRRLGMDVAAGNGFAYPLCDDERMTAYLHALRLSAPEHDHR